MYMMQHSRQIGSDVDVCYSTRGLWCPLTRCLQAEMRSSHKALLTSLLRDSTPRDSSPPTQVTSLKAIHHASHSSLGSHKKHFITSLTHAEVLSKAFKQTLMCNIGDVLFWKEAAIGGWVDLETASAKCSIIYPGCKNICVCISELYVTALCCAVFALLLHFLVSRFETSVTL